MKPIQITLRTMPPSTNSLYKRGRGNRLYMAPEAKAAKEAIAWETKAQYRGQPTDRPVRLKMAVWHADKRKHDLDNLCKALFDSLTGILWVDDSQIQELEASKGVDKAQPRVEVVISEI